MAKFRHKLNENASEIPFVNGGRGKPSPDEVEAREMILAGLAGSENTAVLMDAIKPNVEYASRTDFSRDLAALVALSPELPNKKTRGPKSIRHHLHMGEGPEIYRAVLG